jgi:8-oxo-dGTP pyrophosphatase MutT (NUDIX family)
MEKPTKKATVVLLVDAEGRVCLARKKQPIHHEHGVIQYSLGMYNGYGGKMEKFDKSIFHAAIRELADEAKVKALLSDLQLVSRVYFFIKKESSFEPFMEVSFFLLNVWQGNPVETDEMGEPHFFAPDAIPYDEMMPADKVLFGKIFSSERGVYRVNLLGKDAAPEVITLDEKLI